MTSSSPAGSPLWRSALERVDRIEAYGIRGERQVRLYTPGYLRIVEPGLVPRSSVLSGIGESELSRRCGTVPPQ
ncbi:MAG TPA: hypothetical protein VK929_00100 [Longimicrobiales bacterium]|nr:hypothetical protein [Longimicrobiales bacterium]